jgi:hypothetical protein
VKKFLLEIGTKLLFVLKKKGATSFNSGLFFSLIIKLLKYNFTAKNHLKPKTSFEKNWTLEPSIIICTLKNLQLEFPFEPLPFPRLPLPRPFFARTTSTFPEKKKIVNKHEERCVTFSRHL